MRKITQIFILISFLTGVIAPACGFSWGGHFSVIEICTSDGIKSIVVNNSKDSEKNFPNEKTSKQCQFCFQHANLKAFTPNIIQVEKLISTTEHIKLVQYKTIFLNIHQTPQIPRAPPKLI